MIESHETETAARLAALREAVRIGSVDIDAGKLHIFDESEALERHLSKIASEVIGVS